MTPAETKELLLEALVLDPSLQFRAALSAWQVDKLAAAYDSGSEVPPISVALVNGVPLVTDGWHRVRALKQLGRKTVAALVTTSTAEEAQLAAALANTRHGLQLKPRELKKAQRAALALYLRMKRHLPTKGKVKSFREIGQELGGIDHTTIRRWVISDHPRIARSHWDIIPIAPGGGGHQQITPRFTPRGTVEESLRNALAAFQGIADPAERGAVIAEAEAIVERMKAAGDWRIEATPADEF
ncbi:putative ParB-like nuclease [uncultured Alphaproteobacteria bacterium]|uniref:Putative ParB-like nuclease n=1 Tax=uncultured Alphaproteobacteria bacterium TaxID=91750 RepID=A0A212KM71_9PROT|nr:putative ParB-like nuclease [uncultured Alphaproteobacteria bacterium]